MLSASKSFWYILKLFLNIFSDDIETFLKWNLRYWSKLFYSWIFQQAETSLTQKRQERSGSFSVIQEITVCSLGTNLELFDYSLSFAQFLIYFWCLKWVCNLGSELAESQDGGERTSPPPPRYMINMYKKFARLQQAGHGRNTPVIRSILPCNGEYPPVLTGLHHRIPNTRWFLIKPCFCCGL